MPDSERDERPAVAEVTIRGSVRQCADMHRAEQHVCLAEGVKLVRNGLTADEPPPTVLADGPVGAATKMGKPGYER